MQNIFNINIVRKDTKSIWFGGGLKYFILNGVFSGCLSLGLFVIRVGVFI